MKYKHFPVLLNDNLWKNSNESSRMFQETIGKKIGIYGFDLIYDPMARTLFAKIVQ